MKASALFANSAVRRGASLVLASAACAFGSGAAHAGDVYWSIGISTPHVGTVVSNLPRAPRIVYRPAPVILAPAPIYVAARPYYRVAPIAYAAPGPVLVLPPRHGHWKQAHRNRGHHGHRGHHAHHGHHH